jgi:hypothetical protein
VRPSIDQLHSQCKRNTVDPIFRGQSILRVLDMKSNRSHADTEADRDRTIAFAVCEKA